MHSQRTKNEIFTAILVFVMGFGCGAIWVLRSSDPKTIKEKYHD